MDVRECACVGKVRYLTRKAAKRASKTVAELHRIKGLHPYRCEFCALWHLGHALGQATYKRYSAVGDSNRDRL